MRFAPSLALLAALAACAPVRMHEQASRPPGEAYAGVGEVMLRVSLRDNLPNEFGASDLFGRMRDRGFVELRYLGLDPEGRPSLRRRELEIDTNESVYHHTPSTRITTIHPPTKPGVSSFARPATTITTTGFDRPPPQVTAQTDETVFTLDLAQSRTVTLRGRTLQILEADAAGIRFVVGPEPTPGG